MKNYHYTINEERRGAARATESKPTVFVPGHSLGAGWVRHIVELQHGDTADNPASTKGPLYGPSVLVYDVAPSGTTVHEYDSAKGFYDSLKGA